MISPEQIKAYRYFCEKAWVSASEEWNDEMSKFIRNTLPLLLDEIENLHEKLDKFRVMVQFYQFKDKLINEDHSVGKNAD